MKAGIHPDSGRFTLVIKAEIANMAGSAPLLVWRRGEGEELTETEKGKVETQVPPGEYWERPWRSFIRHASENEHLYAVVIAPGDAAQKVSLVFFFTIRYPDGWVTETMELLAASFGENLTRIDLKRFSNEKDAPSA